MCMFSFQEAASCGLCSTLSASCTTFAVWMPKKMYRISFRQLRPGLDPPQVVVLFLCSERALHRCRPHPGKFLSDKVFLLLLLAERPSSLHERGLYPILLAVVSVVGSGITGVSSHFLRFNSEQPLMHLQAMYQPCTLIELNSHIVS